MIADLPVTEHLDEICESLKNSPCRSLVLTAETGAGKSTAVPVALLRAFPGKIAMLEPRRLASLAVARRVAEILGEEPGKTVGYQMHLESRVSSQTRFTVMTQAILTNMLLEDPTLEGVSVVVIDEFHERNINADLALCFLKEATALRDDLFIIVMSATVQTGKLASYLGTEKSPAPVIDIPGRLFPVQTSYAPDIPVAQAIVRELEHDNKSGILVFLPGIADIRRTEAELKEKLAASGTNESPAAPEIFILHSSISLDEQRKILSPPLPDDRQRVILSSAIAETSLTIPNISTVIDSGFMRINRMNIRSGMETLVTERESIFSAKQRAGRAGRTGPGKCVRLWSEREVLQEATAPEILRSDLSQLVLQCADWGVTDRKALDWFDEPGENAWNSSRKLLEELCCLDSAGGITDLGRASLEMGLSPRLACAAIAGGADCILPYSEYAKAAPGIQKRFIQDCERRRNRCLKKFPSIMCIFKQSWLSEALLAGYPDRLARIYNEDGLYKFPSGRLASLPREDREKSSSFPEWILAPDVDAGEKQGRIYSWKEISPECAKGFLAGKTHEETSCSFVSDDKSKIRKVKCTCYGKIELSRIILQASPDDYGAALCTLVQKQGITALPLSDAAKSFILRAKFYRQQSCGKGKEGEQDILDGLRNNCSEWLLPFITGNSLSSEAILNALRYALDGQTVDREVPDRISLTNGKSFAVKYEEVAANGDVSRSIRPVIEVIIQRLFGCFQSPRIMGVPVLLRLLSPARRPLQVTDDLEGFWSGSWKEICKEMKGRYPKHNWDYTVSE
ncbi:MAG: DEAD/DEAH box helicase [Treponema sp.]|nr:DEAD/DEAH box helicase [Treponema sp.]